MSNHPITAFHNLPPDEEWILTSPGVSAKIREIAEEYGVEILDVSVGHSNLPTTFHVSTSEGVGELNIRSVTAPEVLDEIHAHFKGETTDPADVPVIEETKPENLPPDGKNAPPAPTIAVSPPATTQTSTNLPKNPSMPSDSDSSKSTTSKKG